LTNKHTDQIFGQRLLNAKAESNVYYSIEQSSLSIKK
jgi:hypothetical protein